MEKTGLLLTSNLKDGQILGRKGKKKDCVIKAMEIGITLLRTSNKERSGRDFGKAGFQLQLGEKDRACMGRARTGIERKKRSSQSEKNNTKHQKKGKKHVEADPLQRLWRGRAKKGN